MTPASMNNKSSQPDETAASGISDRIRYRLANSPRMVPDLFWTLTANLVSAGSGIIVFKIISRWIPAHEYGQASLVLGIVGLLNQLLIGPVVLAHLRLYFEHAAEGRGLDYARALLQLLMRNAAILSGIYLAASAIYYRLGNHIYMSLAVPAVLLIFSQAQLSGTLSLLEAEKKYRIITLAQSLSKALQVPFLALLIWISIGGPAAVVSSQMAAGLFVVVIWATRYLRLPATESRLKLRDIAASASKTFGWTLYLFNFLGWILATSDRYIIEHYWTAREVGIYALNYGLWSVPFLSLNAWQESVARARIFERFEAKDWPGVRRLLRYRIVLAFLSGVALIAAIYFFGEWAARLVLGDRYWFGRELMMLICSAHFFYIMGATLHSVFQGLKRTSYLVTISAISAAVNVALNFVLVPRIGILGAGWSTLAAYAVMFVTTFLFGWAVLSKLSADGGANELT
jgi:O-antigen/teichoic acid export membrane protein